MIGGGPVFVRSGPVRLRTERFGGAGDPVVLLITGTSAQGIRWPDELVRGLVERGGGDRLRCRARSRRRTCWLRPGRQPSGIVMFSHVPGVPAQGADGAEASPDT